MKLVQLATAALVLAASAQAQDMSGQPGKAAMPAPMSTTPPLATASPAASALTEKAARQKLADAGYASVSGLKRNADGEWEAMTSKGSKQTRVIIAADGTVTPGAPM